MKVSVNGDACIGCGACQAICPDVFAINDEGLSYVTVEEVDNANQEDVIEAIETCPTGAIDKE